MDPEPKKLRDGFLEWKVRPGAVTLDTVALLLLLEVITIITSFAAQLLKATITSLVPLVAVPLLLQSNASTA
jgi:hypothetical protein